MATINLGSIKFKWKGTYAGGTAYVVDDVVEYNGSSYICILASTGNLPTNATYFEQMSAKGTDGTNGTDGTDLTTTLTTQGDLVYRDASGLARLGAGTSGQVLQTGGTGANPSWGTVSSDFVKISSTNMSGSNSVVFQNSLDNSTYSQVKAIITNLIPSSAEKFSIKHLNGTSSHGNYDWNTEEMITHYAGSHNVSNNYGGGDSQIKLNVDSTISNNGGWQTAQFEINFYLHSSGYNHMIQWNGIYNSQASGETHVMRGGGVALSPSTAFDGFRLDSWWSGGNFTGRVDIYGLKK